MQDFFIWLSDLHLDAAASDERELFFCKLEAHPAQRIVIGGDTADGLLSFEYLKAIEKKTGKEIFFILGNHDCYGTSIAVQKNRAKLLEQEHPRLCYLTAHDPIPLSDEVCLLGHDGWSDGREGAFSYSVCLRDYFEIEELKARTPAELQKTLADLGDESAYETRKRLEDAFSKYKHVVFVTHSPPFRNTCLYQNQISNDMWAPHFVNKAMGQMLQDVCTKHPQNTLVVLAGHSHHFADVDILENLRVVVAPSDLGMPLIQIVSFTPSFTISQF